MKILISGFGSIGRRHYHNLLSLGYEDITVYDPDSSAIEKWAGNTKVALLNDEETAWKSNYDCVLICSPPDCHIRQSIQAAENNCHVFIEKPLSHNLDGVDRLIDILEQKKLVNMVACNLLFYEPITWIRDHLKKGSIGRPFQAHAYCGNSMAKMRPGFNPSTLYAMNPEQGGGVILDTGSHELNNLINFFGPVKETSGVAINTGIWESRVEDLASLVFLHDSGVCSTLNVNFLDVCRRRGLEIVGEKGTIIWREEGRPLRITLSLMCGDKIDDEMKYPTEKIDGEREYIDELVHFFDCVNKGEDTIQTVSKTVDTLKPLLKARSFLK